MNPLLVALVAAVVALGIKFRFLRKRQPLLRSKEQAYKFHEFRDRLQILNAEGKVGIASLGNDFLMFAINLAIRNAGAMRLTDILQMSRAVKKKVQNDGFERITEDIRRQGEEAQKFSAEFFEAFAIMLISNDTVTSLMFTFTKLAAGSVNKAVLRLIAAVGNALVPEQTEALREAREYQRWGNDLAPSY
jgi:hypothetical protein